VFSLQSVAFASGFRPCLAFIAEAYFAIIEVSELPTASAQLWSSFTMMHH
jgi:hypothetical protein